LLTEKATSSQKVCSKCVLPETFPGISFDEDGVCNFCTEQAEEENPDTKQEYQEKFNALLEVYRGRGAYDVLMCFSGGKDSTHTLNVLRTRYDLSVLAVSIDNGFVSPRARENIRNVVETLGTDHIFFKPSFDTFSQIIRRCVEKDIFAPKALEKASSICTACMAIVKYSTLRMALEKEIPFVAYGWSPGQAPITSSIIRTSPEMIRFMQRSLFEPLHKVAGDQVRPYFLEEAHFSNHFMFPYFIHPLAFLEYNEAAIYREIESLGWKAPEDVDANSTNCLLNCLGNSVHKQRLGFNPYAFELANLVRGGYLEREEALKRLYDPEKPEILEMVKARLSEAGKPAVRQAVS